MTCSPPGELAGKTVGVIGGMGPFATADFLHKLISATPAERDQDHMRILIDCNPRVPDRTEFLAGRGPDPRPALRAMARGLVRAGADLLVMPCNTAHAFRDELQAAVDIPVVDWPGVAADAVATTGARSVGILASAGTLLAEVYQPVLRARGIACLVPPPAAQELATRAIYGPAGAKRAGPRSGAARSDLRSAASQAGWPRHDKPGWAAAREPGWPAADCPGDDSGRTNPARSLLAGHRRRRPAVRVRAAP